MLCDALCLLVPRPHVVGLDAIPDVGGAQMQMRRGRPPGRQFEARVNYRVSDATAAALRRLASARYLSVSALLRQALAAALDGGALPSDAQTGLLLEVSGLSLSSGLYRRLCVRARAERIDIASIVRRVADHLAGVLPATKG